MVGDPSTNGELAHAPVPVSGPVRALERRGPATLATRPPSALAVTAGGLLAAVALAALRAMRARRALKRRRPRRRELVGGRVVARRSFLVDVHLLDR
jgi:hypothetical protein